MTKITYLILTLLTLTISVFARSVPGNFEDYEMRCYNNNGDEYGFDFETRQERGEEIFFADMTAKDALGQRNLPYFIDNLEVRISDIMSRCWFGYRVEIFDTKFNRSFVHQEILADMCWDKAENLSYIVKDGSRDHMRCVINREVAKNPSVQPSPFN